MSKKPFSDGLKREARFEAIYRTIAKRHDVRDPDLVALVFHCLDHAGVISQQARERFASHVDARVFDQIEIETLKVLITDSPTDRVERGQRSEREELAQGQMGEALAMLKQLQRDPHAWRALVDEQLERWVAAELLVADVGDSTDGVLCAVSRSRPLLVPPQGPSQRTRNSLPGAEGEEGRLDAKYGDEDSGAGRE